MKHFWLSIFLITSFFLYAEDAVTRATSYGGENISSDSMTSATEYAGNPKVFKDGKEVEAPTQVVVQKKAKVEPEVVLSQRTDDESLRTQSAMRFLPETFEYVPPVQAETKKIPAEAVPYYQSHSPELSSLPEVKEVVPAEVSLDDSYLPETKLLPPMYEKEKPTIVLTDITSESVEESEINSKLVDLPEMQEKIPAVATLDDSYLPETKLLPPTYEKEKPTIVLSDSPSESVEESEINSKLVDLPEMQEKIPAVATLDDSYLPETKLLPPTYEKEKPTIVLSDSPSESVEESEINSKLVDLPEMQEKIPAVATLDDSYLPETKLLPPTYEKEKPTIVLSDDADTDSENSSKPIDLPLPEAIFEEDNTDNESEDLPFIWEEDVPEEEPKEEFYDDDLPTLLDAPEVTLGEAENTQAFDVPQTNILEPQLPEIDLAQQDKPAENETLPNIEDVEPENTQSENVKTQWVFKKDYRKLMDFNENFDGFPKSESDVFNNPARYQYDNENLVEQSEKKIDNSIGNKLFEKAKNYIKSNEADKATKLLEELLHYNFDVPQTEYFLALAEFKNGNHNRAEKYLERSNRRNKDPYLQSRNTELVGEIAFSQGKYAEAYKNFINAVVGVNSKHDAQLYNKAGIAALRAGDIENARRAWKTGSYLGNKDAKRNLIWLDH